MPDLHSSIDLEAASNAVANLVRAAAPSMVGVRSHRSRASGFAWRTGLIVTANDALAEEGDVIVELPAGETNAATIVGRDPTTDIALLRVAQADLPQIPSTDAGPTAGAFVVVVGAEEGAPTAMLGGVLRAGPAWRSLRGGDIAVRIELDVALRSSAEGGLVLDAAGRAIGMAVFGPRRRVLVIPSETIDRVAAKLESHGRIPRGYLGLALQPVRVEGGGIGAMVMTVDATGPAAVAGVRQGDVVVELDGRPVRGVQSLIEALGPDSVGSMVRLSVRRGGAPAELSVTIGARTDA